MTALSLAVFNQIFRSVVPVTLQIERAGLQLLPGSDVKLRGISSATSAASPPPATARPSG